MSMNGSKVVTIKTLWIDAELREDAVELGLIPEPGLRQNGSVGFCPGPNSKEDLEAAAELFDGEWK